MIVSFDLDEVLFVNPRKYETEPPPRFPYNKIYIERLRKGTVDLIHDLQADGFRVWVYTSSYRSERYIRSLFGKYGVHFEEVINGLRHDREVQGDRRERLPTKLPSRYRISLHIDDEDSVIRNAGLYGFNVLKVYEPDDEWAQKVMAEARRIRDVESRREGGTTK